MIIECRHCGKIIDMDSSYAEKMIICPHCRKKVIARDKSNLEEERHSSEKKVVELVKTKEKKMATLADWFKAHMKVFLINFLIQMFCMVYVGSDIIVSFVNFIMTPTVTPTMTTVTVSSFVVSVVTCLLITFMLPYMTVLVAYGTFLFLPVLDIVKEFVGPLLLFLLLMLVFLCVELINLSCITARRFNAINMPGGVIVSLHTIFFTIAFFMCRPVVLLSTICLLLILICKKDKNLNNAE